MMGSKFLELFPAKEVSDHDFTGMVCAIDGTVWLHQFLKVTSVHHDPASNRLVLIDKTCQLINHLRGFLYRTLNLLQKQIWPVFVFDGASETKERNQLSKAELHNKYLQARSIHAAAVKDGAIPLAKAIGQRMDFAYPIANMESRLILQYLGMPVIVAPGEGEAQCAWLQRKGIVDFIVTKDADALLYGAEWVVKNLAVKQRIVEQYNLKDVLHSLGITRERLVDLAILVGTDYHPGVPGFGARTALKFVKAYGCIEDIITNSNSRDWSSIGVYSSKHPFSTVVDELRGKFLKPVVDDHVVSVEWLEPDVPGIRQFLLETHSLSPDLVRKAIIEIRKAESRRTLYG